MAQAALEFYDDSILPGTKTSDGVHPNELGFYDDSILPGTKTRVCEKRTT